MHFFNVYTKFVRYYTFFCGTKEVKANFGVLKFALHINIAAELGGAAGARAPPLFRAAHFAKV